MFQKQFFILLNISGIFLFLLAFSLNLSQPIPVLGLNHAQAEEEKIPNEYIFQVLLLPNWRISEAVFAYELDGKYYLAIGELTRGFEFFVDVDVEKKLAIGFASREENSFTIDGARNELIIKGKRESLSPDAILTSDYVATDDLYVQLELLNKIWPVEMSIDLANLTVQAQAEEELSFMREQEREADRKKALLRQKQRALQQQTLPRRDNAYMWLDAPVIDFQNIYTFDTEDDDLIGTNIISGFQQIGKMYADFSGNFRYTNGEIDRPDSVRLRLSRQSAGDEYIIPNVRKFEAGDVSIRQEDLISNSATGRGLSFSNRNNSRGGEFDEITIEGTGPPGWEIELYNNEELIDFSVVPDDGRYFFEDVVLNYGNNDIKILFFGPQGQVREEIRSYTAGGNMLSPGDFRYDAGFLDSDRELILLDNEPRTDPRGVVKTFDGGYGVNEWLTLTGNYTEIPQSDKDRSYLTVGAVTSTPIGLFETQAYREVGGGEAAAVNYIGKFLGFRTNLSTSFYNDFESDLAGTGNTQKQFETKGQLNRTIRLFSQPIGLRFNALHTERKSGTKSTELRTAQTYSRSGIRISHNTTTRWSDNIHQSSSGSMTTTVREGPYQLRGGFNYTIYPEEEFTSTNAEIRYKSENDFQAALNTTYNFLTDDYRIGIQTGYDFDTILSSLETSYDRGNGWEFVVRATTSLHPYTDDNTYTLSSSSRRQYSPIRAHVFLDKDGDGTFGDGDEPMEGVKLNLGNGRSRETTNEEGYILANVASDRITNISVDTGSIADPYFMPATEGFSIVPLRGKIVEAQFPLIETGSIEGTAMRRSSGMQVPGLTINLVNEEGKVLKSATTAFDGYYVFEFIPPGKYRLKTDDSHVVELFDNSFEITMDDLYIYGFDVFINDVGAQINTEQASADDAQQTEEQAAMPVAAAVPVEPVTSKTIPKEARAPIEVKNPRLSVIENRARFLLDVPKNTAYQILDNDNTKSIDILIEDALLIGGKSQPVRDQQGDYVMEITQAETNLLITLASKQAMKIDFSSVLPSISDKTAKLLIQAK